MSTARKKVAISKKPISNNTDTFEPSKKSIEQSTPITTNTVNTDDNLVISNYKASPCVIEFLIQNAYCAMKSERADAIFEPIPSSWKKKLTDKQELLDKPSIRDIITKLNILLDSNIVITRIKSSYNDKELLELLGTNTYELVRFIIESNKMMIKVENLLEPTPASVLQFKLIHTPLVEDQIGRAHV